MSERYTTYAVAPPIPASPSSEWFVDITPFSGGRECWRQLHLTKSHWYVSWARPRRSTTRRPASRIWRATSTSCWIAIGGEVAERSWAVLRPGGTYVTPAGQPDQAAARGMRGIGIMAQSNAGDLTEIATLVDAGRMKPIISTVLPLTEARAAHELVERGHARGKIVLRVVEV